MRKIFTGFLNFSFALEINSKPVIFSQVMDFTDKPEDEVATALFDAAWDENRAIELLLENGDHLSAWEETGKKKKAKKAANEEKEDWDNDHDNGGGFQVTIFISNYVQLTTKAL